jgi:predicted PP-loop superfamily ATPase
MKICSHCVLPETFPGISFDVDGVCSHCQKRDGRESRLREIKKTYEGKFVDLLNRVLNPSSKRQRSYDVLMAYSGGKDSTYTLSLLRNKYGLRILALSFDNGFISETAVANIRKLTDKLGIDHIFFKPRWAMLKRIFSLAAEQELYPPKTLERASTICTSCMGLVKSLCLRMAVEMDIPMVGYGWSPGQAPVQSSIMKNNPSLIRMTQQAMLDPLRKIMNDEMDGYFLQERHYADPDRFPHNVHPLAWEVYNENSILEEVRKFGWTAPTDTDSNSTNCLLNAFANDVHIRRYGFHPYVWEIANMVREGVMTREEGYAKIYVLQDAKQVEGARKRLQG